MNELLDKIGRVIGYHIADEDIKDMRNIPLSRHEDGDTGQMRRSLRRWRERI